MTRTQKRIVLTLAAVTLLVFVGVVIAALDDSGGEPPIVAETITSTTAPPTSTSAPATTSTSTPTSSTTTTSTTTTTTTTTTSTTTTTTSTTTSTTTTSGPDPLVLRGDGLGIVPFGTEAGEAVTTITAVLGEPDEDSGWIPSFSGFGNCPGEQVRGLRWATMWLLMTDGDTEWRSDESPHFFAYLNSVFYGDGQSLGLVTDEGIGLGDPVTTLESAYGAEVLITFDELIEGFIFNIEVPEPGRLGGGLTGDGDDDLITSVDGGQGCGT